jgi:AcrR family transcriptional regulator
MPDGELSARRQKKIADRVEKILEAASKLFAEKGFHRTTTKEIAEAADVAEGTLYNYFDNKNELLFEILGHLRDSQTLKSHLDEDVLHDPRQFFIALFKSRQISSDYESAMQQAVLSEILVDTDLRKRYYQQLVQPTLTLLEKHMQMRVMLGQIRPVDASLAARYITCLWMGLFILQILGDPLLESDWEAFVQESASILFEGIQVNRRTSSAE